MEEAPTTEAAPADSGSAEESPEDVTDRRGKRSGSSSTRPASAQEDQRSRDRRIWLLLSLAGGVVVVLFLVGFWPVMQGRLDAANQLAQAITLLTQAKGSVSDVDRIVAQQLSSEPSASMPDVSPQVLVARRELTQIDVLIDDAMPHLTDDEQRRAKLVRQASDARLAMLDSMPTLLKASVRSARAMVPADAAWQQTQLADQAEASANAQYAKQTALGVRTSADLYGRASAQLKSASSLYSQAASAFPEAGYARYTDQSGLRVSALKLASMSTASWLSGNTALAKAQHEQYASQSAAAAAVAKALPSPPGRAGGDAFTNIAAASRQAYEAARAKVVAADEALKNL